MISYFLGWCLFIGFLIIGLQLGNILNAKLQREYLIVNWVRATRVYCPKPSCVPKLSEWTYCFVRDQPDGPLRYFRCGPSEEGLFIRELTLLGFLGVPRRLSMFIKWMSLGDPVEVTVPWVWLYYGQPHVEMRIEGTEVSVVVARDLLRDIEALGVLASQEEMG